MCCLPPGSPLLAALSFSLFSLSLLSFDFSCVLVGLTKDGPFGDALAEDGLLHSFLLFLFDDVNTDVPKENGEDGGRVAKKGAGRSGMFRGLRE